MTDFYGRLQDIMVYINLFSKRLNDALSDFGIGFLGREEGRAKIKELKDQYIQQYMKDNPDSEKLVSAIKGNIVKLNQIPRFKVKSSFFSHFMQV